MIEQDRQEILEMIQEFGSKNIDQYFQVDHGRLRMNLVSELWVGAGETSFRANRDGVFAGDDNYTDAPFKFNYHGVLYATGANISGALTATSLDLTGTLTAGDSAASEVKIIGSSGVLAFYYDEIQKAYIYANSSGNLIIDSDNTIYLNPDEDLYFSPGDDAIFSCNEFSVIATGNIINKGDAVATYYNDDNDGDTALWYSNSVLKMSLNSSGDLKLENGDLDIGVGNFSCDDIDADGDIQCGGTFVSSGGYDGETHTGYDLITHVDVPNEREYYHAFDFRDGILTDIGSEEDRSAN